MIIAPTPEQVRAINGSTLTDEQIQPFIDTAVCILTQVELCMSGKAISDSCITQAAAFLAAHLLALTPLGQSTNLKKSEKFENYSVELAVGSYDSTGVLSTTYGNTANALSGGCLQEVDKRNSGISFFGGA